MSTVWNSPGATTCHCDTCDGKSGPACVVCRGDCIELNDAGECAECAPKEDETCEEFIDRAKARRGK